MTQKLDPLNIASLPQPLSPFRWANYIETDKKIYQGFVDLCGKDSERKNLDTYMGRFKARFNTPKDLKYNILG